MNDLTINVKYVRITKKIIAGLKYRESQKIILGTNGLINFNTLNLIKMCSFVNACLYLHLVS